MAGISGINFSSKLNYFIFFLSLSEDVAKRPEGSDTSRRHLKASFRQRLPFKKYDLILTGKIFHPYVIGHLV
jgi:hypothetical protein